MLNTRANRRGRFGASVGSVVAEEETGGGGEGRRRGLFRLLLSSFAGGEVNRMSV